MTPRIETPGPRTTRDSDLSVKGREQGSSPPSLVGPTDLLPVKGQTLRGTFLGRKRGRRRLRPGDWSLLIPVVLTLRSTLPLGPGNRAVSGAGPCPMGSWGRSDTKGRHRWHLYLPTRVSGVRESVELRWGR